MESPQDASQHTISTVSGHRQDPLDCYISLPLTSRHEIRVLDIGQSSDGAGGHIIAGTLRVIDLDQNPAFTALSYVWGKYSAPRDVLHCNGYQIDVTRNCWSAMYHLTKSGPLTIWIDAICINQADDDEKSRQIPLMSKIYSSAQATYTWLRKGNAKTDVAMAFLAQGALPFHSLASARLRSSPEIPTGDAMAFRLALHLYGRLVIGRVRLHYDGLEAICAAAWIERLWTLQEAVLSNNMLIVCGDRSVSWNAVVHSLECMMFLDQKFLGLAFPLAVGQWRLLSTLWREHRGQRGQALELEISEQRRYYERGYRGFLGLIVLNIALPLPLIIAGIARSSHTEQAAPLVVIGLMIAAPIVGLCISVFIRNLYTRIFPFSSKEAFLMEVWRRQATNAEDRYFGVLCFQGNDQTAAGPVPIGASIEVLYTLLFRHVLVCTQSLDVLLFAGHGIRMASAPSWVVDWRSCRNVWLAALFNDGSSALSLSWRRYFPSSILMGKYPGATPESIAHWDIDTDSTGLYTGLGTGASASKAVLSVRGYIVSRIEFSSGQLEELDPASVTKTQLLRIVECYLKTMHGLERPELEYTMTRLWHLSSGDIEFNSMTSHRWLTLMERGMTEGPEWTLQQLQKTAMPKYEVEWRLHMSLASYLTQQGMALVRCEGLNLKAIGFTPYDASAGDTVALLSGVSLPMVLRQVQGQVQYEVVGPAFLPAMLEGQVWRDLDPNGLEVIELV
ncbi:HET-domain-containing protein [Thozetella sp. PMI_491]|nr:HET-domain-containing protein [Thozetella sp. PMI_491]